MSDSAPPNESKGSKSDTPRTGICLAYTAYQQEICEHLNEVNLSGESMGGFSVLNPSPEEKAMAWVIQQNSKSAVSLEKSTQRFALATLFFHNKVQSEPDLFCKDLRQHWTLDAIESTQNECDWFGDTVECSDDGAVTRLRLGWDTQDGLDLVSDFDSLRCFTGTLPSNLALLSNLRVISMNGQDFLETTIPESFYNLTSLELLSMGSSSIGGTISPALDKLTNLKVLDLSRNLLRGEIPTSLGPLSNMQEFRLDHNLLSGTIPSPVVSFGTVKKVLLHENKLTGSIPNAIGQMVNLERLELQGNALTGGIPAGLGNLRSLTTVHAFNNGLADDENPLCSSNQNYDSLSLDCDQVHCPCCTNCCQATNVGASMCTTTICQICHSSLPVECFEIENIDDSWRERALSCSCACSR